ncbi:MAG: helix-turn-helix transcriptional regulator [Candidatus Methanoplasma sp.]|nr:helix-turn-helix transcriptional regulator [Candidatus Methanoplasma sp.]
MESRTRVPRIDCALDASMMVIGGRWKATILCKLCMKGGLRFNQLMRELEMVSPRILTKQLREMENDGLIIRTARAEVPVCVEYSLSDRGKSLIPALKLLAEWGSDNIIQKAVVFDKSVVLPDKAANRNHCASKKCG